MILVTTPGNVRTRSERTVAGRPPPVAGHGPLRVRPNTHDATSTRRKSLNSRAPDHQ